MNQFFEEKRTVEDQGVLASLCGREHTAAEKAAAVNRFKQQISGRYDELVAGAAELERELMELDRRRDMQYRIIEDCKKHRNTFAQIPEYVGLKDEINGEFEKRNIRSKAQFACEYVIGLKDEAWRDAIEAFLGPRRYTILVEPQYYDIADEVLNRSSHRYAHLFNTKLLMKKEVHVEEDSAVFKLEIKNPVAKQYFDYQLGRMHAVELKAVKEHENAISQEGRVSVAMDSYFLRFDRLRSYYLGQKTFELNRIRAERELDALNADKKARLAEKKELESKKARMAQARELFAEYDYDAHRKYQTASEEARESQEQLNRLKKAQENNLEYLELNELAGRLSDEKDTLQNAYNETLQEESRQNTILLRCGEKIQGRSAELEEQEKRYQQYQVE